MPPNQNTGLPPLGQPVHQQATYKSKRSFGSVIAITVLALLLIAALGFGVWAFGERSTYKSDADALIAAAVEDAEDKVSQQKDAEFVEKEKQPNKTYTGPATFASVSFSYPKTWSAFIDESGKGQTPVKGYLHPNFVPAVDSGIAFALRIEVVAKSYDSELEQFNRDVKSGKVKVTPFRSAKMPDILGARVEGEINRGQKNIMVLFPARDKTIKISTESESFYKDFNDIVLKTLTFVP